ncbi:MAG TPA: ABC transporter ATP-binding protein [Thermodesulfobacteriota bacterium]|nr:ABC transporter ATP-binding protein [Thermodesulfobacteriota bacterium]
MESALEIKDLTVSFSSEGRKVEVVSGVSLSIPQGRIVGVVGESGCGKTVTALSVMRLIPEPPGGIEGGEIIFDGRDLLHLSDRDMRSIRGNRISMIFQEPISSLNPVFTVGDQVGESLRTHLNISGKEEKERVIALLRLVGIPAPESRIKNYPHELSGGMSQRVMIAMALACSPEVLIADEPTTALDVTIQAGILELIDDLRVKLGMAVLLITHDLGIIAEVADTVYVMYAGKVVEHAVTRELFKHPKHPYTVGLLNSIPDLRGSKEKLDAIPGVVPSPGSFPPGCRFQDRCPLVIDKCRSEEPPLAEHAAGHYSACWRADEVTI